MANINGDANDNELFGTENNDVIKGLGGNDIVHAGLGDDRVEGGTGNDELEGEEGSDTIIGGSQKDFIAGGEGNDRLRGDSGDDVIIGGPGDDAARGSGNSDVFTVNPGDDGLTILDFQQGLDTILLAGFGFEDVSELELQDDQGGTLILLNEDDSVRINGISSNQISNADLEFSQAPFVSLNVDPDVLPDIIVQWSPPA